MALRAGAGGLMIEARGIGFSGGVPCWHCLIAGQKLLWLRPLVWVVFGRSTCRCWWITRQDCAFKAQVARATVKAPLLGPLMRRLLVSFWAGLVVAHRISCGVHQYYRQRNIARS